LRKRLPTYSSLLISRPRIQYAITGGLWAALVHAGSFDAILNDSNAASAAIAARARMLGGSKAPRSRALAVSRSNAVSNEVGKRVYTWLMGWMFRHDEYTKRCSAHAFGDPGEVKMIYDDLVATGHDLGVSMAVMEGYAGKIRRLGDTESKNKSRIDASRGMR
jgi:hypothetical protein